MLSKQTPPSPPRASTAIRWWLYGVAALVVAMVLVGGGTRLTESGLSIVEWQPVAGALPPFDEAQWQAEFEKYKATPQYQELNRGMSLAAFKTIYWWEWAHRLLGRVIGIAFLVPLLAFAARGWIGSALRWRLIGIFALGAVQGGVGWWMVTSGLVERTSVAPYRLAFHLTLAGLIFAAIVWTAQRMSAAERATAHAELPARIRVSAFALLALVIVQVYLGALVAGLDAGLIYNTWPLIDGAWVPKADDLLFEVPWWRNLFENTLTVQFDHRMVAYLLWIGALLHVADVARTVRGGVSLSWALALAAAITVQAAVGILALLHQMPFALAIAHQALAMVVLAVAVVHAECVSEARGKEAYAVVPAAR